MENQTFFVGGGLKGMTYPDLGHRHDFAFGARVLT
jgi:hypothetical protein